MAFAHIYLLILFGVQTTINGEILATGPPLENVKQWNILTYNLPWDSPGDNKDYYNPLSVVATGIAIDYERIFVATPRLFNGVPATISTVPRKIAGDSSILQAYPDWSYHTAGQRAYNCTELGLVSVYRMRIDSCNRLWALDAGVSRSLEDFEVTCPPKILVFDLNTDQVVRRIDFPPEVVRGESLFTNMVIDETTSQSSNNCDDVFVYITDTVEPAIVVYDSGRDLTWRLSHPAMFPDPNFAQSNILGNRFTLMDGIVGISFDTSIGVVYFQPLATDRLFSVKTTALRAGPLPFGAELPIRLVGKKSSQGIGLALNQHDGSIFFSPFSETAIAEWNPNTNKQKVLAYDKERLQFVADLSAPVQDAGSLYVLSSRFHRFFLRNLNTQDINTRIMRIGGAVSPIQTPLHHGNALTPNTYQSGGIPTYQLQSGVQNLFPTSPASSGPASNAPLLYKTEITHAPYSPRPIADIKSSFVDNFFNSIRQPYQYEPVGVINKAVKNPFTALNTGETPEIFLNSLNKRPYTAFQKTSQGYGTLAGHQQQQQQLQQQYGLLDNPQFLSKINPNFNDYSNSIRRAKSIAFNSTALH